MLPALNEVIEEFYPEKGYSSDSLILTAHTLEVYYKDHRYVVALAHLENIKLNQIRLMFYYLAGAFTVVLSLLAILQNMLAPLPGLFLVLLGATCFYIGWRGKISLQFSTATDEYVFWFNGAYEPFREFINTVRHRAINQPPAPLTFFPPESY